MQASLAEPNTRAIPDQELEAMLAFIAESVGAAITGRTAECVLYLLGEAINANAHVDGFNDQPNLVRRWRHGNCRNKSAKPVTLVDGSSTLQPPGLCS